MNEVSIRDLVGIYDDLDSAIFFDGSGEYLNTGKYTPNEWREKANNFLESYQKILESNTVVAKHDYFLREKDYETQLVYFGEPISGTASKQHNSLKDELEKDRPEEPFEGYSDLIQKMSISAEALKKALKESSDYSAPHEKPSYSELIDEIGGFIFTFSDEGGYKKVANIKYKEKTLELRGKIADTFFCIMHKCYNNKDIITVDEIREYNQSPADSNEYITSIKSQINSEIRRIAGEEKEQFIIRSGKRKQSYETRHITAYKINYKFAASF